MVDLEDRCCIKRCRNESDMIYFSIGICQRHWTRACKVRKTETRKVVYTHVIPAAQRAMKAYRTLEIRNRKKTKLL